MDLGFRITGRPLPVLTLTMFDLAHRHYHLLQQRHLRRPRFQLRRLWPPDQNHHPYAGWNTGFWRADNVCLPVNGRGGSSLLGSISFLDEAA
jgi:hypothetical protein